MWEIFESTSAQRRIKKAPKEVLKRYEAWKRIVEVSGPQGLRLIKGFHDENLKGEWSGYRSSRLGIKCRVIYRIERDFLQVHVFEVNPHEY